MTQDIKTRRARRTRMSIGKGTNEKPRLSVARSNRHIRAQIINDSNHQTLCSASSSEIKEKVTKKSIAQAVGLLIAQKAKIAKIQRVIFDRGPYKYHGRVQALAEGARQGGLQF